MWRSVVSIPFKRESVSKVKMIREGIVYQPKFQFPSNGKVYPKLKSPWQDEKNYKVSIPFKRESVSKGDIEKMNLVPRSIEFQFPSNGKVYPKTTETVSPVAVSSLVSIPFKRESVSKDSDIAQGLIGNVVSFNSLQTGKCIQSWAVSIMVGIMTVSFNSLQTGKCIQSMFNSKSVIKRYNLSFNSLQTGKCIQSQGFPKIIFGDTEFQFPSNGKVYPK